MKKTIQTEIVTFNVMRHILTALMKRRLSWPKNIVMNKATYSVLNCTG